MWKTRGQQPTIERLERAIAAGRESHAYLMTGPEGVGKRTLAEDLFAALNCSGPDRGTPCHECEQCGRISRGVHADLTVVGVEEGATRVSIEAVREATERLYMTPVEGRYSGLIIEHGDLMSEEASNALLKSLEEPPGRTLIMILAEMASGTIDTVRSRCQTIAMARVPRAELQQMTQEKTGCDGSTAERAATAAAGCPGRAFRLAKDPEAMDALVTLETLIKRLADGDAAERMSASAEIAEIFREDRNAGRQALRQWQTIWRDRMVQAMAEGDEGKADQAARSIDAGDRAERLIGENVNARLTLESMIAGRDA